MDARGRRPGLGAPSRGMWLAFLAASCLLPGASVAADGPTPGAVDVRRVGARGDGRTDDRAAFARALASLAESKGGTLHVPRGTYRIVATERDIYLSVPANVSVVGERGLSRVVFETDRPKQYRELFRIGGDGVTLDGLRLTRKGEVEGVFVKIFPSAGFVLRSVEIDGAGRDGRGNLHATEIAAVDRGRYRDVRFEGCTIAGVDYGLFMTNESKSELRGFTATGCRFTRNHADDLQFNAPSGAMVDVTVADCTFSDNQNPHPASGSGFGFGLANVQRASLRDCRFANYHGEAVHIEDRTRDVTIAGCTFVDCGTAGFGVVNLINDSKSITIAGCHFDAERAKEAFPCIKITTGGEKMPTAGDVLVTGNTFRLGSAFHGVDAFSAPRVVVANNLFEGSGRVASGRFTGGANYGVSVVNARWAVVSGNIFKGLGAASPPSEFPPPLSSAVTGNVVVDCGRGLDLPADRAGDAAGNVRDPKP